MSDDGYWEYQQSIIDFLQRTKCVGYAKPRGRDDRQAFSQPDVIKPAPCHIPEPEPLGIGNAIVAFGD